MIKPSQFSVRKQSENLNSDLSFRGLLAASMSPLTSCWKEKEKNVEREYTEIKTDFSEGNYQSNLLFASMP